MSADNCTTLLPKSWKKVLIVTDYLYPYCSANSAIAFQSAKILHDAYRCELTIVGHDGFPILGHSENLDYAKIAPLNYYNDYERIVTGTKSKFLRVLRRFSNIGCICIYFEMKFGKHSSFYYEYSRVFKKMNLSGYDCVVVFSTPFEPFKVLMDQQPQIPVIAFMLDPWSTLWSKKGNAQVEAETEERRMIDAVSALFVTKPLYDDYENILHLEKSRLSKMHLYDFPNIKPFVCRKTEKSEHLNSDGVHCVFAGRLYEDIRNPKYTLKLFSRLVGQNVKLHFFGRISGKIEDIENLPENVFYHGNIATDEADWVMQSADILVNIGNTVMNLIPSKLMTYISTGKPILNIIKSPKCPTLPYMAKYPLALNVLETPEVRQEDADRVVDFIKNNVGKRIPFEEIKEKYHTCTPEYVGKQLYDVICEVVEEYKEKAQKGQHGRKSV